jgi:hypothetical protein
MIGSGWSTPIRSNGSTGCRFDPALRGTDPRSRGGGLSYAPPLGPMVRDGTVAPSGFGHGGSAAQRCVRGFGRWPHQRHRIAPEAVQAGLAPSTSCCPTSCHPGSGFEICLLWPTEPGRGQLAPGEREYRRFNFAAALSSSEGRGCGLGPGGSGPAGAQAASWLNELPEAADSPRRLATCVARLHGWRILPEGSTHIRRAGGPQFIGSAFPSRGACSGPGAHMALGEVYYHLLPAFPGRPTRWSGRPSPATADTGHPPAFIRPSSRFGGSPAAEREAHGFERVPVGGSRGAHMLACVGEGRGVE